MTTRALNVFDYRASAEKALDPHVWDFIEGGAEDEVTLRANRAAFEARWLRPRVLVDVSACDTSTTLLGTPVRGPIIAAPIAYQGLVHPEAECATARGAAEAGSLLVASMMSTKSVEAIAHASNGPRWLQLYMLRDRGAMAQIIQRAEANGYRALILTADAPRIGRRERDKRNAFALPAELEAPHLPASQVATLRSREPGESAIEVHARHAFDDSLTWEVIGWIRQQTHLPIVLKGIMTAEDARLAANSGAAGIVVSNHGGRQLDGALATLDALEECVEAVDQRCEVYLDGGVRRGTDVLKALAMGARAVLIGRPILWGLAAEGATGVAHVLELIRAELEHAMCLAGRPSIDKITRALIRQETR